MHFNEISLFSFPWSKRKNIEREPSYQELSTQTDQKDLIILRIKDFRLKLKEKCMRQREGESVYNISFSIYASRLDILASLPFDIYYQYFVIHPTLHI